MKTLEGRANGEQATGNLQHGGRLPPITIARRSWATTETTSAAEPPAVTSIQFLLAPTSARDSHFSAPAPLIRSSNREPALRCPLCSINLKYGRDDLGSHTRGRILPIVQHVSSHFLLWATHGPGLQRQRDAQPTAHFVSPSQVPGV